MSPPQGEPPCAPSYASSPTVLSTVPTLIFIFSETKARARVLARRELLDHKGAVSVEVYEGGELLWTLRA